MFTIPFINEYASKHNTTRSKTVMCIPPFAAEAHFADSAALQIYKSALFINSLLRSSSVTKARNAK